MLYPGKQRRMLLTAATAVALCPIRVLAADTISGKDPQEAFLSRAVKSSVPLNEILSGGPPVDGIPALSHPARLDIAATDAVLSDQDDVLGIAVGGESVAYPIRLLNWHEIINDTVGGLPIAATYCPLCRSGIVFERKLNAGETEFGVSGLLYKSDLVMYDRETRSLWSQIMGQAVVGSQTGTALNRVPAVHTTWARWKKLHPKTTAVGFNTGHSRDYGRDPYRGYERSRDIYFPVGVKDERLHPKEVVFGIRLAGTAVAVPVSMAGKRGVVKARIGSQEIVFRMKDGVRAYLPDGTEIPGTAAYWFAWAAFNPDSRIISQEP